jgi:hypothetical protein
MVELDWEDRCADALLSIRAALGDLAGPRHATSDSSEEVTAFRNAAIDDARTHLVEARRAVERARDAADYT